MDSLEQQKLLLKIVIGAAWVDRHLEPEEIDYFKQLLTQYDFHLDSELQELLQRPVPVEVTSLEIVQYLKNSTDTERLKLLSAIANMFMADENVSEIEHEVLDEYYELMANIPPIPEASPTLVETVGRFVKKLIGSIQV